MKEGNTMTDGNEILKNTGVEELLLCAKRAYNVSACSYKTGKQPLVLCHFSDIHGDDVELERIVALKKALGDRVNDFLCTGDMVPGRLLDGYEYWKNTDGAGEILTVIGNHDVLSTKENFDFSQRAEQSVQFKQYMAPFIASWGVCYEENKTYYYKDYPTCGIRLIAINEMLQSKDSDEQFKWFEQLLADSLTSGLTVVCASHSPRTELYGIKTGFSSIDRVCDNGLLEIRYYDAVDAFIAKGGSFAVWLTGHFHSDHFGMPKAYPDQLFSAIDSSSRWQSDYYTDMPRVDGTIFQDVLNLTVIDTTSDLLHIIRIGANRDRYLRSKKYLTVNYKTKELICTE